MSKIIQSLNFQPLSKILLMKKTLRIRKLKLITI